MTDTQNEADDRGLAIDRVGIRGLRHPVVVRGPASGAPPRHAVATYAMAVDLPANLKGTHMSRFVEALHECGGTLDLADPTPLPRRLLEVLPAHRAFVSTSFTYFIEKSAPATGRQGWLDHEVRLEIEVDRSGQSSVLAVLDIPVATLCPCSKAISDRGAHNQRGVVSFHVRPCGPLDLAGWISLIEQSASCELYSLLKRPDEKLVTERAFDNPVFVEDLVRNAATRASARDDIGWFRIEAENFESIHNHSAWAVIERQVR